MFPVMMDKREWEELNYHGIPKQLPMSFVKQFEDQIKKNHDQQTVERLAERGGLHPTELCAAMYGMDTAKYFGHRPIKDPQTKFAINLIVLRLNEFNRKEES